MITASRLAALAALLAAGSLLAAAPAGAAPKIPKIPKIKTRIAKVEIQVSGYVETRLLHDTTSDCFPGEYWIQRNRYDFDTSGYRNVSLKRVTGEGFAPIVTSNFTVAAGRGAIKGDILDYRTTNYCGSAPAPVRPKPTCATNSGRTQIGLAEAPLPTVDDDDLAPLTMAPLLLSVRRVGGGRDADGCIGPGAGDLTGIHTDTAVVTTSIAPSVSEVVPAGVTVPTLFRIRPGQRISRAVTISGPCTSARVTTANAPGTSPGPGGLNADGDCWITGKITYTIRPRPTD